MTSSAFFNRVYVKTSTTGQGTIALGNVVNPTFLTFAEAGASNGATVDYIIEEGNNFEIGQGTYSSAGPTLSRDTVRVSKIGGVSGITKMTLAGNATVRDTVAAESLATGVNTGDQTSISGNAETVTIADAAGDTTTWLLLGTSQTGNLSPATDAGLIYNANTNALTAGSFVGSLTGNADTATNVGVIDDSATNATMYPLWVTSNSGNLPLKVSATQFNFNPSTGLLSTIGLASNTLKLNGLTASTALALDGSKNAVSVNNTGTGNNVLAAGAALTALTGLGIRSTGAAFDLTINTAEVLTAGRTLSIVMGDAARILTLGGNATLNGGTHSGTNTGDQTNISGNAATVTTNANLTGPITSVGNATSVASQTGTGTKFVMDTSPTVAGLTTDTLIGTSATDASSTTAAAFKTAGGLGVVKKSFFGDLVTVTKNTGSLPAGVTGTIMQLGAADGVATRLEIQAWGTGNSDSPGLFFRGANGTAASPTATVSGDFIGFFGGIGRGATVYGSGTSTAFLMYATENWTDSAHGCAIDLATSTVGTASRTTRVTIGSTAAQLSIVAGTATLAPLLLTSGTNLTSAAAGACEYDGVQFYQTIDTTSGRGTIPVEQYFHLAADGGTISTIANFFGSTSNISLVANAYYEIEIVCFFLNTTAGTVTWTLTNSAAPTSQNIEFVMSPVAGVVAPPGTATNLEGQYSIDATAAKAFTTGTLTTAVDHYARFKIMLKNGAGTSLKIQTTKNVGGTITPRLGSYWKCRRISPNNIGTFAA